MTGTVLLTLIFLPMTIAFIAFFAGKKSERLRDIIVITAVTITFVLSLLLLQRYESIELRLVDWGAFALHFYADGFRVLYASVTALLWLVTTIFSRDYLARSLKLNRYWFFNLLTFGAVMGVFFSADFRTAFLFFEIMSFCSYVVVAHNDNPGTRRASETYLAAAIISGLVQLMGMALLFHRAGTLEFAALHQMFSGMQDKSFFYLPGILLLIGFGTKAGMYPLHVWLPKAYHAAPAPATALLSGILSKTGIFGLVAVTANVFMDDLTWGVVLLVPAVITMVFGAVLAVFSDDFKRTVAFSSISQIGFILVGVAMLGLLGQQNALAAGGSLLHMLNHTLFKLLLFVAAGIVFMNRNELSLDKIRGFGRGKPLFFFVFLMAALGITGVPFWSGFVSKVLLKKSLSDAYIFYQGLPVEYLLRFSYAALVFAGGLTFAYITKLFVTLFMQKGDDAGIKDKKRYISLPSAIALAICAALVPVLGIFTGTMDALAVYGGSFFGSDAHYVLPYFTRENIQGALISLVIGAAVYLLFVRNFVMRRKVSLPAKLDLENLFYRPLLSILTLSPFLRYSDQKEHMPGKLMSLYLAFTRRMRSAQNNPAIIGHFSLDLLLVAIGISVAVIYVFVRAFAFG